ncbi:hypothetical protein AAL_04622 [Moelleriella libera RCEF 2490]|uniref:Cell surface protein (Mas1) n=1 Tax=Moelleriella libera RCEF 2490 TaxID=1081109 RepID=A0A168BJP2_9HYPO|nr:hypothetical protein AAL_04622 [Moelleriella libera RCEF 2490]
MRYSIVYAALVASVSAHGVVTKITGANGVEMPGLSIADGTPRDCTTNRCGAQADTAIIRDRDIQSGKASPLGRTQGGGPIDAEAAVAMFMSGNAAEAKTAAKATTGVGKEDDLSGLPGGAPLRRAEKKKGAGAAGAAGGLTGLLGGLIPGGAGAAAGGAGATGIGGLLGGGAAKTQNGPPETMVAATAGSGASSGLPTCSDSGEVTMTFRQINQDGAGPLTAAIDPKSGGKDASAFQNAQVTQDVPGLGIQGLSLATNSDFPVKVQMPQGMTCEGKMKDAENVCIVRVQNGAAAGPFGGSAAFTQSKAARKRAIAYRLRKRMEINRSLD